MHMRSAGCSCRLTLMAAGIIALVMQGLPAIADNSGIDPGGLRLVPGEDGALLLRKELAIQKELAKIRLEILRFSKSHEIRKNPLGIKYHVIGTMKLYDKAVLLANGIFDQIGEGVPLYDRGGIALYLVRLRLAASFWRVSRILHFASYKAHGKRLCIESGADEAGPILGCDDFDCDPVTFLFRNSKCRKAKKLRKIHEYAMAMDVKFAKIVSHLYNEKWTRLVEIASVRDIDLIAAVGSKAYLEILYWDAVNHISFCQTMNKVYRY